MPICTTCTHYVSHLFTVYQSAYNLRLEQCSKCHSFVDPYVEHDSLTLLLDLILLKRGVYRHLLYNRGTEPRRAGETQEEVTKKREVSARNKEKERWVLILRLGAILIFMDAFIRWSHLNPNQIPDLSPWTKETIEDLFRVFLGCLVETLAFHLGIIAACSVTLQLVELVQRWKNRDRSPPPISDIKREFRFSLIPLTLFYSSLTKLFLLFLLTIWRPTSHQASSTVDSTSSADISHYDTWNGTYLFNTYLLHALDDQVDREWIIRNVLGGMSAGFGLRVILDIHPLFTSIIILAGWAAKTSVASLVSGWVGGDEMAREAWRAYSIP
ncbi:Protein arv1 [Hypsizygus marmoreus]|uniref:Protein ARV n=1 Tax=Hypsizygus marmoreus TaxID=39966 RepID=A0A369JUF1_HYPMA|nr:Protein arv1 [Hypsizygus marmoreus]